MTGLLDGSPFRDDAAVVLSELFTNAVVHTASGRPGGLVIVQLAQRLDWHDDASGRTIAAVLGQPPPRPGGPPLSHAGAATALLAHPMWPLPLTRNENAGA